MSASLSMDRRFASSNALKRFMALQDLGLDHDHMHDGKNAGLREIRRFHGLVVGKQAPDALAERARWPRRKNGVEFACEQHVGERALRFAAAVYAFWQFQLYLFHAAGLVHPRLDPLDRVKRYLRLMHKVAARADNPRLGPLGHPDAFPL